MAINEDSRLRWKVLEAAVDVARLDMLSHSVAAPAAGLYEAHSKLNAMVRHLVDVDPRRSSEFGHIDYKIAAYKKATFK